MIKIAFTFILLLTPSYCVEGMDETVCKGVVFAAVIIVIRVLVALYNWFEDTKIRRIREDLELQMEIKQRQERMKIALKARRQSCILN